MISPPTNKLTTAFWSWHLLLPLALFLLAVTVCELSGMDLYLADRLFDFSTGIWPARNAWWAEWLIHKRGRDLIALIAGGSLLLWLGSFWWGRLHRYRWMALYLALSIGLSTGAVTAGKKLTGRHCPWDLDRYGGTVPHTTLFEGPPPGCKAGNCFPAGHASGGFSIMSGYFVYRDRRRNIARSWLIAGLLLGGIFGYGQMARGAHFLSHNIWTAIVCWLSALVLYLAMRRLLAEDVGSPAS
jgi:membrane-associated PAP2 superfamily phosphatase